MRSKLQLVADENMLLVEELFGSFAQIKRLPGRKISASDLVETDLLLVRSVTQVSAELLSNAKNLKYVGTATIGTDHIDTAYLETQGIAFSSAPGCNAQAVVDYTLMAIWSYCIDQSLDIAELSVGIIGCGNVGQRLKDRLDRIGCRVLSSDPPRAMSDKGYQDTDLDSLLSDSNIICCHAPLVIDGQYPTHHLLNSEKLKLIRSDALLLNAGRGGVIDSQALKEKVKAQPSLKVVQDVWEHEPLVDLELAKLSYLATPHIAGYSLDGKLRGTWMLYQFFCQLMQIEVQHKLEDLLPQSPIKPFSLSDRDDPMSLMKLVYDPWLDDRRFRQSLSVDSQQQATNFDLLRKHYPERREFSSLAIHLDDAEKAGFLAGLGFNVNGVSS